MTTIAAKPTVQSVAKPVFDALAKAKDKKSLGGAKISQSEAKTILKAMDKAVGDGMKKLAPEDAFDGIPAAVGLGMMQSITKKDFVNPRDFQKVWASAVDIASESDNVVQALTN
jgi:hypothetical protein